MKKYYESYIKQHEQIWVFFVFIIGWGALFLQHMNVGMFFDDYGNASLSYSYEVPGIVGTEFGVRAILEWAYHIYMGWGGRLLYACLFLIPMLKHGITLFMIIQSFVLIFLLYTVYRIACKVMNCKTSFPAAVFTCTLYCLIDITFHNNGTYWASASVLYIWPLLPMFLSVMYYNYASECIKTNKKFSKPVFGIVESILVLFTTLSQEQWGGALIVFFLFYILFHHIREEKKYLKMDIYLILFSFVTYLMMLMSPGNMNRMTGDQEKFSNLSLVGKIQTNLPIILDTFASKDLKYINIATMIATFFLTLVLLKKNGKNIWNRILFVWSVICFAGYALILGVDIKGIAAVCFSIQFLFLLAAVSITYLVSIEKLEYFAFLMASVASVFCLVLSPYIVYRSYLAYIFIVFTYILIGFMAMLNSYTNWLKAVPAAMITFFTVIGIRNYAVILHGYYENQYITRYNVEQLENWHGDGYIVLYRYPQQYSMYRNLSISDATDYSGVITKWVRRYYGISENTYLIWEDMDKKLDNTIFDEMGSGIYQTETDGTMSWNWAQKKSTLNLYNFYQVEKPVVLQMEVETPQTTNGKIVLTIDGQEYEFAITSNKTKIEVPLTLKCGRTNVHVKAEVKQVDSGVDSRNLYLKIVKQKLIMDESVIETESGKNE